MYIQGGSNITGTVTGLFTTNSSGHIWTTLYYDAGNHKHKINSYPAPYQNRYCTTFQVLTAVLMKIQIVWHMMSWFTVKTEAATFPPNVVLSHVRQCIWLSVSEDWKFNCAGWQVSAVIFQIFIVTDRRTDWHCKRFIYSHLIYIYINLYELIRFILWVRFISSCNFCLSSFKRVLLVKLEVTQLVKKFSALCGTWWVITVNFIYIVDRASLYNLVNKTNLVHKFS